MLAAVHDQAVVDLVREDDQLVLAGDVDDLLQDLAGVQSARGVVGVDDHDGLGAIGDLGADVGHVGVPVALLVAEVVHHGAAGQRGAGRPQGVVGAGNQNLVAGVEQRRHREVDQLAHAVAGIDVVHRDVGQALDLRVLHDGLAGREEATRRGVALAVGELVAHVVDDLVGRPEAKGRRVADVELEDVGAALLHAVGLVDHGSAHVVEDVVKLAGLLELAHLASLRRLRTGSMAVVGLEAGGRGGRRCRRCRIRLVRRGCLSRRGCVGRRGCDLRRFGPEGPRSSSLAPREPVDVDAEERREQRHGGRARQGLAAHVLAQLALAELLSPVFRRADEVDLLEPALCHRLLEAG